MNKKIKILLYSSNIWMFGYGLLGPLFAVFAERLGGSILDISWAWAIYLIVAGILTIIFGKFSDGNLSKKKLMLLGYILNTIFTFSYLFVSSPLHLLLVQIGIGVAYAMAEPTWDALYTRYQDKKQRGYEWGLAVGGSQIVSGIAVVLGGFIVIYFSFKALFIIMGIVQLIATLYQAQILKK